MNRALKISQNQFERMGLFNHSCSVATGQGSNWWPANAAGEQRSALGWKEFPP
jgi:hypothetical protein